jgi:hypothetical protein
MSHIEDILFLGSRFEAIDPNFVSNLIDKTPRTILKSIFLTNSIGNHNSSIRNLHVLLLFYN